jgi:hypothetical protein
MGGDTGGFGTGEEINEDSNDLNVGGLDTKAAARIKRHGRVGEAR